VKDCVVIRGGKPFSGRQGLAYFEGISVLLDAQGRKS
jgi:uncharacterized RmlC-like cupin family protein